MIYNVINCIAKNLHDEFNYPVHVEEVPDNFSEPCFCIKVLNPMRTPLLKERFILNLPIDVQLFLGEGNRMTWQVIETLMNKLKMIDLYDDTPEHTKIGMLRGHNISLEIVDRVGHIFVEYKPIITPIESDDNLMNEKAVNFNVSND